MLSAVLPLPLWFGGLFAMPPPPTTTTTANASQPDESTQPCAPINPAAARALSCTLSIPVGFHLLAPSKEQHTGEVIAELTAGERKGGESERESTRSVLRLEWLLGL